MHNQKVMIIGEIYVDVHLDESEESNRLLRLGGIFHAIRTLRALDVDVVLAYFLPNYLRQQVDKFVCEFGIKETVELGVIDRAPNIMLISNSQETKNQGYEDVLRCNRIVVGNDIDNKLIDALNKFRPTDVMVFPTTYPISNVFFNNTPHPNYNVFFDRNDIDFSLLTLSQPNHTYFFSSSSTIDQLTANELVDKFAFLNVVYDMIIYKENRGGSVIIRSGQKYQIPAFLGACKHSVGVGDSYGAAFVACRNENIDHRGRRSSYIASLYSQTFDNNIFKTNVSVFLKDQLDNLGLGIRLPWEERSKIVIYLAGPDFPNIDTHYFDEIEKSLQYHNFTVIRPIKAYGLINSEMNSIEKNRIINSDMECLHNTSVLVAVMANHDPGMYAEIGFFTYLKRPIILFDPNRILNNSFVEKCISTTVRTVDELLVEIFVSTGEKL